MEVNPQVEVWLKAGWGLIRYSCGQDQLPPGWAQVALGVDRHTGEAIRVVETYWYTQNSDKSISQGKKNKIKKNLQALHWYEVWYGIILLWGQIPPKTTEYVNSFFKKVFFLQKGNQKICTDSVFAMMVAGNLWVVFWQRKNVFC